MALRTLFARARRSLRDDARLHVLSMCSLLVAFLSLGAALLTLTNLESMASRWQAQRRLTVYLKADASESEVSQIELLLESLPGVARLEHVTAEQARTRLQAHSSLDHALSKMPLEAFPASFELKLVRDAPADRASDLTKRILRFRAVEDVESYEGWFDKLSALTRAGSTAAFVIALLVLLGVLAVVSSTIRLALVARREEIEVLKLCGASDAFVRGPFVLEGTLQAATSALMAVLALWLGFASFRGHVDGSFLALTGAHATFLHPLVCLGIILAGGALGALGSLLSLRMYLRV